MDIIRCCWVIFFIFCCFGSILCGDQKNRRKCKQLHSSSVDFTCSRSGNIVPCDGEMLEGTLVNLKCKNYYIPPTISFRNTLTCINGIWDYNVPQCVAECGTEQSEGVSLILEGHIVKRNQPWSAVIYKKVDNDFTEICRGTIITNKIIISAAHCFHTDTSGTILKENNFVVGVGKSSKKSDSDFINKTISKIYTPATYGGLDQNLQQDIAIIILNNELAFSNVVHPVCLDLEDPNFQKIQLTPGSIGKIEGWEMTQDGGQDSKSEALVSVNMPVVDYNTCRTTVPNTFRRYLTVDKFCAGWNNGTSLCGKNSGAGLIFSSVEHGVKRFYLRGILSVVDKTETICNKDTYSLFTNIFRHKDFIKDSLLANEMQNV